jgi:alpha(1,3/1,4) fucosyltransferase
MKKLKIDFDGFWAADEVIFEHYFKSTHCFLFTKYDVVIDKEIPDVTFCSVFGQTQKKNNSTRILLVHEPIPINQEIASVYDYVISFSPDEKNNIRIPYFVYRVFDHWAFHGKSVYPDFKAFVQATLLSPRNEIKTMYSWNRPKFCAYVQSKPVDYRNYLLDRLNEYKRVDCGGNHRFNLEGPEAEIMAAHKEGALSFWQKMNFFADRKFSFACENSWMDGYVTEKIIDSYMATTLPIYYGGLHQDYYINDKAFVNLAKYPDIEGMVLDIKWLDNNAAGYREKIAEPLFHYYSQAWYPNNMLNMYEQMIAKTW